MLLVGWIMYADRDQDEEDEQRPDDLNQQLDLRKEHKRISRINQVAHILKHDEDELIVPQNGDIFCCACELFNHNI